MINLYIDYGDLFLEMIATGQRSCQVQRNDGPAVVGQSLANLQIIRWAQKEISIYQLNTLYQFGGV